MACGNIPVDVPFSQILQGSYLECSLCEETYKQPKSLICFHTFCQDCLEKFVQRCNNSLVCPKCRKQTGIPQEGIAGLPNNLLIRSLAGDAAVFKKQMIKCNNCDEAKVATNACSDCSSYLCEDCYKAHQTVRALRDTHHTFDVRSFSDNDTLREFQDGRFDVCQTHKEPMKLFCKTDNTQVI